MMTTEIALQVAILTSAVAILVAVVSQASAWALERFRQTYERRRASLLEMQDQALELRGLLAQSGNQLTQTTPRSDPLTGTVSLAEDLGLVRRRSHAERALRVRLSRVEDASVREAVETWLEAAHFALLSSAGDDDVTPAEEEALWDAMCVAVGEALARPVWRLRRRGRRQPT